MLIPLDAEEKRKIYLVRQQRLENKLDLNPIEQRKEERRHQRDANLNSIEGEFQGAPEHGQTFALGQPTKGEHTTP